MLLIGIVGRKRHGKDTIGDYLVANYDFDTSAFALDVKKICKALFDFNNDQLYGDLKETIDNRWGFTPRDVFNYFGTHIMRNKFHDMTETTISKHDCWNYKIELFLNGINEGKIQENISNANDFSHLVLLNSSKDCFDSLENIYVKEICRLIFNFNDDQIYGDLQDKTDITWGITPNVAFDFIGNFAMGDEFHKEINSIVPYGEFWKHRINIGVKSEPHEILNKKHLAKNMAITDCRFPNEGSLLKKKFGAVLIKIIRPDIKNDDTLESEKYVDEITDIDYTIINDGTIENLYNKIDEIMINIL